MLSWLWPFTALLKISTASGFEQKWLVVRVPSNARHDWVFAIRGELGFRNSTFVFTFDLGHIISLPCSLDFPHVPEGQMLCPWWFLSNPTLCDPMDCSSLGSTVRGIFQALTLEWAAISSSRGSPQARDQAPVSYVSCVGRRVLYH